MCVGVNIIPGGGGYCDTVGELRAALSTVVFMEGCEPRSDRSCLCYLDAPATAAANGMICRRDDSFDWEFTTERPA